LQAEALAGLFAHGIDIVAGQADLAQAGQFAAVEGA
jgi:hypothetical protein